MKWITMVVFLFLFFLSEEAKELILKILVPAWIGVTIKLATMIGREKLTWVKVAASYTTGLGSAYLCGSYVLEAFSTNTASLVIATIAIGSEKITEYLMYKLDLKEVIDPIIQAFISRWTKK